MLAYNLILEHLQYRQHQGQLNLLHAKSLVDGTEAAASGNTASGEGTTIDLVYGYPSTTHIDEATGIDTNDYVIPSSGVIRPNSSAICQVAYVQAAAGAQPTVTISTGGCYAKQNILNL